MTLATRFTRGGALFDGFVMFWLVLLQGINLVDCVRCLHCKDNITPGHEPDECPLVALVASNVVAITAATGAVVSVGAIF